MARSLSWKATVALSTLACIFIFCISAQAQFTRSKITYSCRSARLETVIDFLSKQSGYDFIYSRNLVDISKPVSLSVKDQSITQILSIIEKQVNVSFKLQDHHIIVKGNPKPAPVVVQESKHKSVDEITSSPAFIPTASPLITSLRKTIPVRSTESQASQLQNSLQRRIDEIQKLLGPNVPRTISPYYVNQINLNNRHKGWFAAVGTSVGDNSAGVELQAGLPFAYAVFRPRYSSGRGFYGAYGVGTSFRLTGNFSLNTIYMFSGITTTTRTFPYSGPYAQSGPEYRHTVNERHHQVKLVLQYALSKNLGMRVGPVLNYKTTRQQTVMIPAASFYEGSYTSIQYGTRTSDDLTLVYQNGQLVAASKITRHLESWVGFDASVFYRINFFPRR